MKSIPVDSSKLEFTFVEAVGLFDPWFEAEQVLAEVKVDPLDWLLLVEYQITDRFVMAVEEWAATGAGGRPPDAREHVLEVLSERRQGFGQRATGTATDRLTPR